MNYPEDSKLPDGLPSVLDISAKIFSWVQDKPGVLDTYSLQKEPFSHDEC
jgi:hypothetical protein